MKREGFYKPSEVVSKAPLRLVADCVSCGLSKGCISPFMPLSGKGKKKMLVVGEAPGRQEDQQNRPFVGPAGELLQQTLRRYKVELREDCWITNALVCRPPNNKIPNTKCIDYCRPNMIKVVKELRPEVILLLGNSAVRSLIDHLWTDESSTTSVGRWVGRQIPCKEIDAWVCPTWHPSYLLHEREAEKSRVNEPLEVLFDKHIKEACKLSGRPGNLVPDLTTNIRKVFNPDEAAGMIRGLIGERLVCWDLETTTIKPEGALSRILCGGLSNGDLTFAYSWQGEAIEATRELLASNTPKLGHNTKFDVRWVVKQHQMKVRNIAWDSMLAAHVLDNRHKTASLEFLAFAVLGIRSHKSLKRWMKGDSKGCYAANRLASDVELGQLLGYCASDVRITYEIAKKQMRSLGHVL